MEMTARPTIKNGQSLLGKVALVTGGSRGIGAATVQKLAAQGASVIFTYARARQDAEEVVANVSAGGGCAFAIQADVAKPEDVHALFATIDRDHGGALDIVVNNAGVLRTGSLAEFSDENYDETFDVNVRGVFYVTREALTRLHDGGRVINIGSGYGERVISAGISVYAATKFAVNGFTRGWARDLAPRGITVNTVQPGFTDTEMNPADPVKNPQSDWNRSQIPVGRYGHPEEVASVVAFLAGPEAAYITGTTQTVDGGLLA
jgi:3-oxoacyl-[acyl-carrier protein] reductase